MEDALQRLNLLLARLRDLAFDRAPNMAKSIFGVQAILRTTQPLTLFVHCGAHCTNLIAKDSCDAPVLIWNSLCTFSEMGRLFADSLKFCDEFAGLPVGLYV